MDFIIYIYLFVFYMVILPVCMKGEDVTQNTQQLTQRDDTSRRDTQRILLGVIVLELILIIVLLKICLKTTSPRQNLKNEECVLPSSKEATIRDTNTQPKKLFGYRSNQLVFPGIEGKFTTFSRNSSTHVDTDENLLLQENLHLHTEMCETDRSAPCYGLHPEFGSTEHLHENLNFRLSSKNDNNERFVIRSDIGDSQSSKQRVKPLPRDFML